MKDKWSKKMSAPLGEEIYRQQQENGWGKYIVQVLSIVKVEKNTGKVKLKKKGKCKIWAKAHNGKNSKAIVVTVK